MILVTHFACCHQYKGYWRSCPLGWSYFTVMPGLNLRAGGAHAPEFTSGTPLDNAVAETFFATFKKEETYRREYTSERHFRKSVDEYIRFYNEVRPHQTLKYKTPQAFEATYQSSYIEKPCSYSDVGI